MMIRHRRKLSRRRLHIEHLESREMLSVSSTNVAGALTLTGTGASDLIQVTQSGNKWKVTGLGTTKIDGKSSQSFTGVTSIAIDLGNGNNYLKISDGTVPTFLSIAAGKDSDTYQISNITTGAGFQFTDAGGTNSITVSKLNAGMSVSLVSGNGTDAYSLSNITTLSSFKLQAGNGTNTVSISNLKTNAFADIEGGNGTDSVAISNSTIGSDLDISVFGGTDVVTVTNTKATASFTIDMGAGSS